jgi:hypothetical protein
MASDGTWREYVAYTASHVPLVPYLEASDLSATRRMYKDAIVRWVRSFGLAADVVPFETFCRWLQLQCHAEGVPSDRFDAVVTLSIGGGALYVSAAMYAKAMLRFGPVANFFERASVVCDAATSTYSVFYQPVSEERGRIEAEALGLAAPVLFVRPGQTTTSGASHLFTVTWTDSGAAVHHSKVSMASDLQYCMPDDIGANRDRRYPTLAYLVDYLLRCISFESEAGDDRADRIATAIVESTRHLASLRRAMHEYRVPAFEVDAAATERGLLCDIVVRGCEVIRAETFIVKEACARLAYATTVGTESVDDLVDAVYQTE